MALYFVAITLASLHHMVLGLQNGQAQQPLTGYNTWNVIASDGFGPAIGQPAYLAESETVFALQAFMFKINETIIKQTADLIVGLGLKDAGYTFNT